VAYFIRSSDAVISFVLTFPAVQVGTVQLFRCKNGERAGFQILALSQSDGSTFYVSSISDYSTGLPVLKGTIAVLPGVDLAGGYFSSACFADADPLASGTNFYRVDYV